MDRYILWIVLVCIITILVILAIRNNKQSIYEGHGGGGGRFGGGGGFRGGFAPRGGFGRGFGPAGARHAAVPMTGVGQWGRGNWRNRWNQYSPGWGPWSWWNYDAYGFPWFYGIFPFDWPWTQYQWGQDWINHTTGAICKSPASLDDLINCFGEGAIERGDDIRPVGF